MSQTPVSRYHELEVLTLQGSHHSEPEIVCFLSQSIRHEYEFLNLISHKSSLCYFPVSCHSSFPLLQSRLQSSSTYRSQQVLNLCCFIHHFNSQLIAWAYRKSCTRWSFLCRHWGNFLQFRFLKFG